MYPTYLKHTEPNHSCQWYIHGMVPETLLNFWQNWNIWTSWRLFNNLIISDVYFETLLYIFKLYRTVMHSLIFGSLQIIAIILNNIQLVLMSQLCQKLSKVSQTIFLYVKNKIEKNINAKFFKISKTKVL